MDRITCNIIALAGTSGSGKSYIAKSLCDLASLNELKKVLKTNTTVPIIFKKPMQYTTRPKRENETCLDYNFLTAEEYNEINRQGLLTARTHFGNNYYGTLINDFIFSEYAYNIIPVSKEALNDLNNFESLFKNKFGLQTIKINIKTALVLSSYNEEYMKKRKRNKEFFMEELFDLTQTRFDYYIPNFVNEDGKYELDAIEIAKKLDFEVKIR